MDNANVSDFQSPAWKREIEHSARMQKQRAERDGWDGNDRKLPSRALFFKKHFPLNKHQYSKESQ